MVVGSATPQGDGRASSPVMHIWTHVINKILKWTLPALWSVMQTVEWERSAWAVFFFASHFTSLALILPHATFLVVHFSIYFPILLNIKHAMPACRFLSTELSLNLGPLKVTLIWSFSYTMLMGDVCRARFIFILAEKFKSSTTVNQCNQENL